MPTINKQVSTGNLVSWGLILVSAGICWGTLKAAVTEASNTAKDAKIAATAAQFQAQSMHTDIEVIKVTVVNVDKNVGDLKKTLEVYNLIRKNE